MGILGLAKLIADVSPHAVKETDLKSYFGRKVAIDASMCLYQFLTAVRSEGNQLTSSDGETTSHLMGTFYSNIRLMENGIKPIYVFDGKPPNLKSGELEKRAERREEAKKQLEQAESTGDTEAMDKFNRRLVKVGKQHVQECKDLLKLMGIPYFEAPGEAEAQCAALVKAGKVYATATEDMDALTFGSNVLLRHITFSAARKIPIQEFHLDKVLAGLELNQSEFIDLGILLGCDYCDSIRGIGPKRAMELIQKHRNIETILDNLDKNKFTVPSDWIYKEARELFVHPEVADCESLEFKWVEPDEEGLVKYLCGDKQFNEERVRNGVKKLRSSRSNSTQGRLDSFFKVLPATPNTGVKRKVEDKSSTNKKKKATPSGKFRGKAK
ncbi:flap endonuclease 1-like [Macrosteles quadrilineatus]|uniref:flap endonuclease 1-like n=1 Tax=Macrosteles quadrilineatus TaxID=74068 RepID=UPI0023E25972|nr:flap endonuclease 1-like [Macrosteles quadrilineatus]XP_054276012.1 flap endonuclease 1-like [Macrosteles quadrilineatus]